MNFFFRRFLGKRSPSRERALAGDRPVTGEHEKIAEPPERLYLVGDVHGRLDLLKQLEEQIADDAETAETAEILLLGDLIDRGTESAGVLDHLIASPPGRLRRRALAGNHELMFLRFLEMPKKNLAWLQFGGLETLDSYGMSRGAMTTFRSSNEKGRRLLRSYVPEEHVAYLKSLPLLIEYPHCIAVHAGLRPGIALANQSADDLTTIREGFLDGTASFGKPVVHGHTPVMEAEHHADRFNVDTGAYATGRLTALCLKADGSWNFMSAGQRNQ